MLASDPRTDSKPLPTKSQDSPAALHEGKEELKTTETAKFEPKADAAPAVVSKPGTSLLGRLKDSHHDLAEERSSGEASTSGTDHLLASEKGIQR